MFVKKKDLHQLKCHLKILLILFKNPSNQLFLSFESQHNGIHVHKARINLSFIYIIHNMKVKLYRLKQFVSSSRCAILIEALCHLICRLTLGNGEARYFYIRDNHGNFIEIEWLIGDSEDEIQEEENEIIV